MLCFRRVLPWACVLQLSLCGLLSANDELGRYLDASTIPPQLLVGADAVVRFDSLSFTSHGIHSSTSTRTRVVTILNAAGRGFGSVRLHYNSFRRIRNLDGELFDATGASLRSLETSDIKDNPAIASYSLYEDERVKEASLLHSTYPYTVVLTYEIHNTATLNWPEWYPEWERASVEHARFVVAIPMPGRLRYWKNAGLEPQVAETEKERVYTWQADNLMPLEPEPEGPASLEQYVCVKTAPDEFQCDGVKGSLSSWESFGKWYLALSAGRQTLSEKTSRDVARVIAGAGDTRDKVKRLYEYLQGKTRYVSIQLGLGSWQPYEATYVEEKGYGDCKALTNFLHALLNEAHIKSYPALIHAASPAHQFTPEFPHNCFNHVVLCVPLPDDTLWLECTSQTSPFGHMGSSTEGRFALAVTPDGGKLLMTPSSASTDNCQIRRTSVKLSFMGSASAGVRTTFAGNQQDRIRHALDEATPRDRRIWLREDIQIPSFVLGEADFSNIGQKALRLELSYGVEVQNFASVAGARLLFQPNIMERRTYVPPPDTLRKQPIIHSYRYLDIDSVHYALPEGYTVEALPKPVTLTTDGAEYASSITHAGPNELLYVRRLEVTATSLPREKYGSYRSFWESVVKADKSIASLVRK